MKLTPMASMRISTWPGPGTGIGNSASSRTSGPPVARIWIAFMTGARMQRKGRLLQVKGIRDHGESGNRNTNAVLDNGANGSEIKSPRGSLHAGLVFPMPDPCSLLLVVPVSPIRQHAWFFREAQAYETIDGIRGALLAGVVVTHLQLAQEADGEHLNSGHDQHSADHEHRSVL